MSYVPNVGLFLIHIHSIFPELAATRDGELAKNLAALEDAGPNAVGCWTWILRIGRPNSAIGVALGQGERRSASRPGGLGRGSIT